MRVANGPASTHVKSMTRSPSSGFPAVVEPRWRRPSARGVSSSVAPPGQHVLDRRALVRRGLLLGDAAAAESGERAGQAHVGVALDRAERPAVFVLRVRRHLLDGLHLAEGDVPALRLGEELARVLGEREPFDGRHDPRHLAEHLLDRERGEFGTFLVTLLGHPLEERRRVGGGGDVAGTGPGVRHHVRPEPVQRPLTQRPLRQGQEIGEPPLEEQVLERRGDRLMERQVDVLPDPGLARIPHAGEPTDRCHERAEVHVLASPRVDGVVGRPRNAQHATQRPGDEVTRLPVGAWAGATEGRERDLDEPRVDLDQRIVVQAQFGEPSRRRRFDHEIGALGQPPIRRSVLPPSSGRRSRRPCRRRTTSPAGHRVPRPPGRPSPVHRRPGRGGRPPLRLRSASCRPAVHRHRPSRRHAGRSTVPKPCFPLVSHPAAPANGNPSGRRPRCRVPASTISYTAVPVPISDDPLRE